MTMEGKELLDHGNVTYVHSNYIMHFRRHKPELKLRLFDEKTKEEKICYLRDDW